LRIRANFYHTFEASNALVILLVILLYSIGKSVKESVGEAVDRTPIKEEGEAGGIYYERFVNDTMNGALDGACRYPTYWVKYGRNLG